ncbi:MAG: dihydrolipoyl dehydrogenase [Spirochaetaceae bacterium]|nr:MAG: dihydrolipoyl dehydrogenase [Spirochaetaceae bacterium]
MYDLIVLGGGPGGYVAAIRASQLGLKTALVEKRATLGGTCLNVGCIPSKALLDSSELFARIREESASHGITVNEPVIDVKRMLARKDAVVKKLTGGVAMLMKANRVEVFHGTGSVREPGVVEVQAAEVQAAETAHLLKAKNILLATGSVPIQLPFLPLDGSRVVDSTGALSFDTVPEHLIVIGGGVIGLELGSVWRRLGSRVTVVELLPQIMTGWDSTVARTMKRELEKQGIEFLLETKVSGVTVHGAGAGVTATDKAGKEIVLEGDRVLVAVGRKPYLEGIDTEKLGLAMDGPRIRIDRRYETSVPGIRAIGDIVPGPMLAHKAEDEGIAAAECIAGKGGHVNYETIPNVIYTWPEAASAGKTEDQLKQEGVAYRTGSFPFAANGRALAMDALSGSVRILADAGTDRVLGAHIVGPWASDLIGEIVSVMEFGGSAEDIARTVHAHPTLSEAVKEAALGVEGRMIHGKN